jgi:hypothetical protein
MASISSDPGAVSTKYTLDLTNTEVEHVFPETPAISEDDQRSPDSVSNQLNWYRVFFDLDSDEGEENWPSIKEKFDSVEDATDIEASDYDQLRDISEHIIQDIGNQILLEKKPNQAIRNTQFSIKSLGYYLTRKGDLDVFDDPIAEPRWLNLSIEELVKNAECLGLKLGEGDAMALLYRMAQVFDFTDLDEISSITDQDMLEDTNKLEIDQFGSEYNSVEDLLAEFEFSEDVTSKIQDKYGDFSYDSDNEVLSPPDDEGSIEPSTLIDEIIILILTKVVSEFDITELVESPSSECNHEEDYIVDRVNKIWNWENVVRRKVEIIESLLEEISMSTVDGEFTDLDSEFHKENILSEFKYR